MNRNLILLDRDGVINKDLPCSVRCIEDFEFLHKVPEAIALLNRKGFRVVVITNQAVVGRGFLSESGLQRIHEHMLELLKSQGAHIHDIFYCTDVHASSRRKPGPGMVQEALKRYAADPSQTPFVGDSLRDLEAAHNAQCLPILVRCGKGEKTLQDLPETFASIPVFQDLWDFSQAWDPQTPYAFSSWGS